MGDPTNTARSEPGRGAGIATVGPAVPPPAAPGAGVTSARFVAAFAAWIAGQTDTDWCERRVRALMTSQQAELLEAAAADLREQLAQTNT